MDLKSLENNFKIFQIFGYQFFTINSVITKEKSKYSSIIVKVHFLILLIVYFGAFLLFNQLIFRWISKESNYFNSMLIILSDILIFLIVLSGLFTTIIKNSFLINFFECSQMISVQFENDFNRKFNFKIIQRDNVAIFLIYLVIFFAKLLNPEFLRLYDDSVSYQIRLSLCCDFFLDFCCQLYIYRFAFYVRIINFHLQNIKTIFSEEFSSHRMYPNSSLIHISLRNNEKTMILKLEKSFKLIKMMVGCVSESMGFVLLLVVSLNILNILRDVYELFVEIASQNEFFSFLNLRKIHTI
jgi:hypothetical protein